MQSHLYDVVGGMGALASPLQAILQQEFGRESRYAIRLAKKLEIESVREAFEIIERHTETVFAAWFSTDMILAPIGWNTFTPACGTSASPRTTRCTSSGAISVVGVGETSLWATSRGLTGRCSSRLGYDCRLWNHRGINMTAANVAPFFTGRPDFDGAIVSKQVSLGWFVSTYRATEAYHLEHPDRPQYTKMKKHPGSLYNRRLMMALGGVEFVNEALDIRISRTEISERRRAPGTSGG
jgi:hypothetical protein